MRTWRVHLGTLDWRQVFASVSALLAFMCPTARAADNREAVVDQLFSSYQASTPGCSLGVVANGAFVLRRNYGSAKLELGVPLSNDSVFYIASVSKQFTASAVVLAAEQKLFSLDDSVRKYIPELPSYAQAVTIRQMLHHASGFRDVWSIIDVSGRSLADTHTTKELFQLIVRQKALDFEPGTEYQYNNTNYFLLGEIIRRASGKSLAQFAEANMFHPLGMTKTHFHDDRSMVVPGRVSAYSPTRSGEFTVNWSTNFDNVGSGGVMTTVDDLLRWDQNYYANRLGDGSLIQELAAPFTLANGQPLGVIAGGDNTYRGLKIIEMAGAMFGYRADLLRFPTQRFTVICLCNSAAADPVGMSRKIADLYLANDFSPSPAVSKNTSTRKPVRNADVKSFAGRYLDPRDHTVLSFTVGDHGLMWRNGVLSATAADTFESGSGRVFRFKKLGSDIEVVTLSNGFPGFTGKKIPDFHPDTATLQAYAGVYSSMEINASYELRVEGDHLVVYREVPLPEALSPVTNDEFDSPAIGRVSFHRDDDGRISELGIYFDGIRDLRFARLRD